MPKERRRDARVRVNLPARWESFLTQQEGTIVDLSRSGCFVLSGGKLEPNELIRLEITLPNDERVYPWAEVTQAVEEIGFSARFTSMDDEERERLEEFVRRALAASS
jgi:hypothetical protein